MSSQSNPLRTTGPGPTGSPVTPAGGLERAPIVVGVDGSESSRRALDWAAETASRRRLHLAIVYVFPRSGRSPVREPAREVALHEGRRILRAAERHVELGGWGTLHHSVSLREGTPVIVLTSTASDAGMLVVGRRGRGRFAELLLGSTSRGCALRSSGPLVVVPNVPLRSDPNAPVVVGVDGTDGSLAAIDFAFAQAATRGTRLLAVHCAVGSEPDAEAIKAADTTVRERQHAFADVPFEMVGSIGPGGTLDAVNAASTGSPAASLLAASEGAALVVVGGRALAVKAPDGHARRGEHRVGGRFLGPVPRALMHHARCPVARVPITG